MTLATELRPNGIRVDGLHFGMILEESLRRWFHSSAAQEGVG